MYVRPAARRDVTPALLCALLTTLALQALPGAAWARQNGILTSGCSACHGSGNGPRVTISVEPKVVELGATATITVRIATGGGVGGFYLYSYGKGAFKDIPGQGTRLATPTDVIHSSPKNANDGEVTFAVQWTAPGTKGTVTFEALAVAGNGNGNMGGDSSGQGRISQAIGCVGVEKFLDTDKDGIGTTLLPKEQVCDDAPGYSSMAGDCNDYLDYVHPGAEERCNAIDDDCDGQKDEGLESTVVYKDTDGDGYGDRFTMDMRTGCAASGYAANRDDCDDADKAIHPMVKEVCNNKDDDCNGRVDEGAKASCGLGWCRRNADGCDSRMCTPGAPRAEQCNLFDDDCDGVIDNAATCEPGKVCFEGRCLVGDDARAAAEAQASTSDGGVPAIPGLGDAGVPPPPVGGPGSGEGNGSTAGNGEPGAGTPAGYTPAKPSSLWGCTLAGPTAADGGAALAVALALALLGVVIARRRSR
jgi:hypothetical protein